MLVAVNQQLMDLRLQRTSGVRGRERLAAAERLLAQAAQLTQHVVRAACLLEVADAWLDQEPAKAKCFARRARELIDERSAPNVVSLSLAIEADAVIQDTNPAFERAYHLTQRAIKLARQHRERATDPVLRATSMRDRIRIFESATLAALAVGRLDSALEAAESERPTLPDEPPLHLTSVQEALQIGELAIVYTWLGHNQLLVAAIARNTTLAVTVFVDDQALRVLDFLSDHLRNEGEKGWTFYRKDAELLDDLHSMLLPPLVASQLATASKIYILPHRSLHAFPFNLLRFNENRLGLLFPWTTIPNLGALCRRIPVAESGGLTAVGVDHYPDFASTSGFESTAEQIVDRHRKQGFSACRLTEPGACDTFLQMLETGALDQSAFLLLACHGTSVQGDAPEESFLQLGPKRLTADKIAASRICADLVVLAACCSGQRAVGGMGIHLWPGDDLFGLQAALRTAGARQVIGSLWNVDVGAAKTMANLVYDAWTNGADAAASLHRAARELCKKELHRRNYDWAPFTSIHFGMKA
jgi:CHAT domain-containing protein